jgi:antibiotic biosynthesis monooxygenase (ABM) superfamily enzyme
VDNSSALQALLFYNGTMSIEFNNENQQRQQAYMGQVQSNANPKGMAGWLINKNVAKSPAQANMYLVIISVIFLVVAGFLALGAASPKNSAPAVELNPTGYVPG